MTSVTEHHETYKGYDIAVKRLGFKHDAIEVANGIIDLFPPWRCGYVRIPKDHAYDGRHYDIINEDISVHGGLTYADKGLGDMDEWGDSWVIGFDCNHYGDTPSKWPLDAVIAETKQLVDQIIAVTAQKTLPNPGQK